MDGVQQVNMLDWVQPPFNSNGHTWTLGGMIDNPSSDGVSGGGGYIFDDIYFDYTQARVMIGNSSTFSGSNHREIQIPVSWSDSGITATLNQGSFANGASVYIFVVDANGNASPGYPIILGQSGSAPTVS